MIKWVFALALLLVAGSTAVAGSKNNIASRCSEKSGMTASGEVLLSKQVDGCPSNTAVRHVGAGH